MFTGLILNQQKIKCPIVIITGSILYPFCYEFAYCMENTLQQELNNNLQIVVDHTDIKEFIYEGKNAEIEKRIVFLFKIENWKGNVVVKDSSKVIKFVLSDDLFMKNNNDNISREEVVDLIVNRYKKIDEQRKIKLENIKERKGYNIESDEMLESELETIVFECNICPTIIDVAIGEKFFFCECSEKKTIGCIDCFEYNGYIACELCGDLNVTEY